MRSRALGAATPLASTAMASLMLALLAELAGVEVGGLGVVGVEVEGVAAGGQGVVIAAQREVDRDQGPADRRRLRIELLGLLEALERLEEPVVALVEYAGGVELGGFQVVALDRRLLATGRSVCGGSPTICWADTPAVSSSHGTSIHPSDLAMR